MWWIDLSDLQEKLHVPYLMVFSLSLLSLIDLHWRKFVSKRVAMLKQMLTNTFLETNHSRDRLIDWMLFNVPLKLFYSRGDVSITDNGCLKYAFARRLWLRTGIYRYIQVYIGISIVSHLLWHSWFERHISSNHRWHLIYGLITMRTAWFH